MARLGKRKRYGGPVLGLDLRDGGVRGVLAAQSGQTWRVQSASEVPALEQLRPAARKAVVVLGFQHVLIRRLKLPRLPLGRLRALIEREGDRYIPFYAEGANFDLQVLRAGADAKQVDLLLTAVPSRLIQPIEAACRAARLNLVGIDIDLAALYRAALATEADAEPAGLVAVLEVDAGAVRIGLFQDGLLLGGRAFDREGEDLSELAVATRRSLEVLLSQQKEAGKLAQLFLVGAEGGSALAEELLPLLQADIGHRLTEAFSIRTVAGAVQAGMAAPFGASLARAIQPLSVHLLPRLTLAAKRQRARKAMLWAAGAAALAGYGWYWSLTVPQAQQRIGRAEQTIQESQQALKRKPEIEKLEKKQKELSMVMASLRASEMPLHQVVPGIRALAPAGMEVQEISGQVPDLTLKGVAKDPALVVTMLQELSGAPFVASVELRTVVMSAPERFSFDLAVSLKGQRRGTGNAAPATAEKP